MAVGNKEHECWISEQDSIISFKAVADYAHHCFDTRDELMDYILDALSRKSYFTLGFCTSFDEGTPWFILAPLLRRSCACRYVLSHSLLRIGAGYGIWGMRENCQNNN